MADFQKQDLRDALDLLPERQKEVLFLKYYNGMSYDEIEEILAINYQSIRNHIYRALQKLRIHFMEKENSAGTLILMIPLLLRSEERRVGKECRSRCVAYHDSENKWKRGQTTQHKLQTTDDG